MTCIPKQTVEQLLKENVDHDCGKETDTCVKIVAVAELPTIYGHFQVIAFENNVDKQEHVALVHGNVFEKENVSARLHSECLTGDVFGSLRCDCREQLHQALKMIGEMDNGVILYLRQEGRGIGLTNKVRAYQLQDYGYDTFEANVQLGFRPDERDYDLAAHILSSLHVKSIKLMTNNPEKIRDLQSHGVNITGRIPIIVEPNKHNAFYLETKRLKGGHLLDKKVPEIIMEHQDEVANPSKVSEQKTGPSSPA